MEFFRFTALDKTLDIDVPIPPENIIYPANINKEFIATRFGIPTEGDYYWSINASNGTGDNKNIIMKYVKDGVPVSDLTWIYKEI